MTSIGQYAFCGCSLLKNIRIPASVTSLGECALGYLNADIIIEGPAKFGLVAFRGSKETLYLNADIPETTKDYRNPFYLNELKKVVIGGNAKVVGKNACYNSTKLQDFANLYPIEKDKKCDKSSNLHLRYLPLSNDFR